MTVNINALSRLISVEVLDLSVHEDGMTDAVLLRMHEAPLHLVLQLHVILRRQAETRSADSERHALNNAHADTGRKLTRVLVSDLMTFSMHARCRKKALTTGAPFGTSGALQRKLSRDRTL